MPIIGDNLGYTDTMNLRINAEKELQRPINPSIYTRLEFDNKRQQQNSFLTRIMQQKTIPVIGKADVIKTAG